MRVTLRGIILLGLLPPIGSRALPAQDPTSLAAPATDPLTIAKGKVGAALAKTAAMADTRFTANWGLDKKPGQAPDALLLMLGMSAQSLTGSWHRDQLRVTFDGEQGDELVIVARRMIARDGNTPWAARSGRFADGNPIKFLPDVPTLLQRLATWDLTVTQRRVSSLDDRPVEIVSVTLDTEQAAEATWAGLVPDSASTALPAFRGLFVNNRRQPATKPNCTLDLAITFDPATGIVHQLRSRRWEAVERVGGRDVVVAGGAVTVATSSNHDGEDDTDEDATTSAKDAPLQFDNGLPVRPRKQQLVTDFTLRLLDHGQVPPPELTAEQKRLLGL